MNKSLRYSFLCLLTIFSIAGFWLISAAPGAAHWADMAAAEVVVGKSNVQMMLTFPTGLVSFADDNSNGQLSASEVERHRDRLQSFLAGQIRLTDRDNRPASLTIQPSETTATANSIAPNTHTTLRLDYTWMQPVHGVTIQYGLFLPGVTTAHCLATILQSGHLQTFMFTPHRRVLALVPGLLGSATGILAIAAAFFWGAMHSLTPGHGKTMVGAYLIGQRATAKHALFLALTTTITHTIGVFALGLITLFATQYILPQQLYPWMNLVSGVLVALVGINLLGARLRRHAHSHNHSHPHLPNHAHAHGHSHDHSHPHSPTWHSLLALGISGGLLPCPAALVLLLGAIALNQVGVGLLLVLAFSLGLAVVLTGLGLALIYTRQVFDRVPKRLKFPRILPAMSAACITLIGVGISAQALLNMLNWARG